MVQLTSKLASDYKRHGSDTGSSEVQIALLTEKINNLTGHFKTHAKDFGSKRGLLILVGRRRKLLDYLARKDHEKYKEVIQKLGLRK
jgi:small subunit ribosomal protein S15